LREEHKLLEEGLEIVAMCKETTGDLWHAHYGVAAIASYFFLRDNLLPGDIRSTILNQATAMLNMHSLGEIKESESRSATYPYAEKRILDALEGTIDELHWVGHHVIYSALSLLAIKELGSWGTEKHIDGIVQLIHSFEKTIPGRSWLGLSTPEVKRLAILADDPLLRIQHPSDLSVLILSELSAFNVIYKAEAHHDLIGHLLTYSHALNILYDLGHESLFHRGFRPLLKMVKVLRMSQDLQPESEIPLYSPVDRLPLEKKQPVVHLPLEKAFWLHDHHGSDWDFGHVFKFTFSYYNHLKRVPQHIGETSLHNFRYVLSL